MVERNLQLKIDVEIDSASAKQSLQALSGEIGSLVVPVAPEVSSIQGIRIPAFFDGASSANLMGGIRDAVAQGVGSADKSFTGYIPGLNNLPDRIGKAVEDAIKPDGGGLGGLLSAPFKIAGDVLKLPFQAAGFALQETARGVFIDAGASFGRGIGLGRFSKDGGKKAGQYADRIASEVIGLEDYLSTFLGEVITSGNFQKASDAAGGKLKIGKYLESLGKLALLTSTPQGENYLESIRRSDPDLYGRIDQKLDGRLGKGERVGQTAKAKAVQSVAQDLTEASSGLIDKVVQPVLDDLGGILRFISKIQTYRTTQKALKEADRINALFPLLQEGEQGILNVVGGAMFREGEGGRLLQAAIEGLVPDKRVLPVQNPDTDPHGEAKGFIESFILDQVRALAPDALKSEDFKNTLINAIRSITSAIDPNFISTAAVQAIANAVVAKARGIKPEDIATLTYSLGGAEGVRIAAGLNELGLPESQVLAMAYPFLDIAKLGLPNYQSTILKNDPLNFGYDLGLPVPENQSRLEGGKAQGFEAHAYKHLFKVPEFLALFYEKMGQLVPDDPAVLKKASDTISAFLHGTSGLYELFGSIAQAKSLLATGQFDLNSPFKAFLGGDSISGIDVIAKLAEAGADSSRLAVVQPTPGVPAEAVAIARSIPDLVRPVIEDLVGRLREAGASLPQGASADDLYGYLKLQAEAPKLNQSIRAFKTGAIEEGDEAHFAGGLNPETVSQRLRDFDLAIQYFKKAPLGSYREQIIQAFESLKAVAKEFADTGRLSDETKARLREIDVEHLTGDLAHILNQTFDPRKLKGFEELRQFQFEAPKWAYDLPQSVLAYNKMAEELRKVGLLLPDIQEFERAAYGMSGAAALLTEKLVYKTDINDPQKIASEQEVKAYERLAGRHAPQLYSAEPGQFLITERIKGTPVKNALDELAAPAKSLDKERKELSAQLEKVTQDNPVLAQSTRQVVAIYRQLHRAIADGNEEQRVEAQNALDQVKASLGVRVGAESAQEFIHVLGRRAEVLVEYRKAKKAFNDEAEVIYRQIGQLGKTLQELGVAHNDLASANVFITEEGLKAIDLGNSIVDPTTKQKLEDQITTIQRALIDRAYYGLLDPIRTINAIRSGYAGESLPDAPIRPIDEELLIPKKPGEAVPLGSQQGKLLETLLGDYTASVADIQREINQKLEAAKKAIADVPATKEQGGALSRVEVTSSATSTAITRLGDAADRASKALAAISERTFPVGQQGAFAIVRQGLSDINRFGVRPLVETTGTLIKTADTITNLLPYGPEVKGITKNAIIPAAAIGLLSHTPVAGQALDFVGQLGSQALGNLAPSALSTTIPVGLYQLLDSLLQLSQAGGIAGAAATTGAGLAKYGAYQYVARQGKSLVDVTYERIAEQGSLPPPSTNPRQLSPAQTVVIGGVTYAPTASTNPRQLPPAQASLPPSEDASAELKELTRLLAEVREAYDPLKGKALNNLAPAQLGEELLHFLDVLERAQRLVARLNAEGLQNTPEVIDAKAGIGRYKNYAKTPIKKLADQVGGDVTDGLEEGIDLAEVGRLADQIGITLTQRVRKILGISSPSKVFIKIGKDVVYGFELGIADLPKLEERLQEIFDVSGVDASEYGGIDKIAKDIREGTSSATRDFEKQFVTLQEQGTKTAEGVKSAYQQVERLLRAAGEALVGILPEGQARRFAQRAEGLARALKPLESAGKGVAGAFSALRNSMRSVERELPILRNLKSLVKDVAFSALAFVGVFSAGDAIVQFGRAAFETSSRINALETSLSNAAGSSRAAAEQIAFVRAESERLKIPIDSAIDGYRQLANAVKGSAFQGAAIQRVFTGLTQAARVNGLTTEQLQQVYVGAAQVFSKGAVQAEELRGQILETGIGSYQQYADVIGITTEQLTKRLDLGRLGVSTFIKFADKLAADSAAGVEKAVNTPQAALAGLQNIFTKFQEQVGKALTPAAVAGLSLLGAALKGVGGFVESVAKDFQLFYKVIEESRVTFLASKSFEILGAVLKPLLIDSGLLSAAIKALVIGLAALAAPALSTALVGLFARFATFAAGLLGSQAAIIGALPWIAALTLAMAILPPVIDKCTRAWENFRAGLSEDRRQALEAGETFDAKFNEAITQLQQQIPLTAEQLNYLKNGFAANVKAGLDSAHTAEVLVGRLDKLQSQAEYAADSWNTFNDAVVKSSEAFKNTSTALDLALEATKTKTAEAKGSADERRKADLQAEVQHSQDLGVALAKRKSELETALNALNASGAKLTDDQRKQKLEAEGQLNEITKQELSNRRKIVEDETAVANQAIEQAEAERQVATQALLNQGVITEEDANLQRLQSTRARIFQQIQVEGDSAQRRLELAQNEKEQIDALRQSELKSLEEGATEAQIQAQLASNERRITKEAEAEYLLKVEEVRLREQIRLETRNQVERKKLELELLKNLQQQQEAAKANYLRQLEDSQTAEQVLIQQGLDRRTITQEQASEQLLQLERDRLAAEQALNQGDAREQTRLQLEILKKEEQQREAAKSTRLKQIEDGYLAEQTAIQDALNKHIITQDRASQELLNLERDRIRAELEANQNDVRERARLTLELLKNEEQQQEKLRELAIKRIETTLQAEENAAQRRQAVLNAVQSSLEQQNRLLEARRSLLGSVENLTNSAFEAAKRLAKDPEQRKQIEEDIARSRLNGLLKAQEIEQKIFELKLKQEESQRRIALEQNKAEVLKAAAEREKIYADPRATNLQKQAADAGVVAALAQREALQEAEVQARQIANYNRQEQQNARRAALIPARLDLAEKTQDPRERQALIRSTRNEVTSILGIDVGGSGFPYYSLPGTNRRRARTPELPPEPTSLTRSEDSVDAQLRRIQEQFSGNSRGLTDGFFRQLLDNERPPATQSPRQTPQSNLASPGSVILLTPSNLQSLIQNAPRVNLAGQQQPQAPQRPAAQLDPAAVVRDFVQRVNLEQRPIMIELTQNFSPNERGQAADRTRAEVLGVLEEVTRGW